MRMHTVAPKSHDAKAAISHAPIQAKLRILVAEPSVMNRMLLSESLHRAHCLVRLVETAEATLHALQQQGFDAVFLDEQLTDQSGMHVIQRALSLWQSQSTSLPMAQDPSQPYPMTVVLLCDQLAAQPTSARMVDDLRQAGIAMLWLAKPVVSRQIQTVIQSIRQQQASHQMAHPQMARQLAVSLQAAQAFAAPEPALSKQTLSKPTSDNRLPVAERASQAAKTSLGPWMEDDLALIDIARLQYLQGRPNGAAFLSQLIHHFIAHSDAQIAALGAACSELNLAQSQSLAAVLATEAADLGLLPLSHHGRYLRQLDASQLANMADAYQHLAQCYAKTRDALLAYHAEHTGKLVNR